MPVSACQTVTINETVIVVELGFRDPDPKALPTLTHSKAQS